MNLFRRWTAADDFQQLWPVLRGGFSKAFVDFAGVELNLGDSDQEVICEVTCNGTGSFQYQTKVPSYIRGAPPGRIDFEPLLKEFRQEWPVETRQHDFLKEFKNAGKLDNPSIIVAVPPRGVTTGKQVFDIAFAVNAKETPELTEWRVFIWIRGAHRRLGIGGKLLDHLIKSLSPHLRSNKHRKLIVILPELPRERPGYALEKAGWLHFFGRHGFKLMNEKGLYRLERFDSIDV